MRYVIEFLFTGPPSAPKCALQGQTQQTGTAGVASEMVVRLRDQFGNECESSNAATLDVKITAKDEKNNLHVVPATLKDNKNGTLVVGYSPVLSGMYSIAINVVLKGMNYLISFAYILTMNLGSNKGNGPIAGSPFSVNVAPGPCDPSKVEISTHFDHVIHFHFDYKSNIYSWGKRWNNAIRKMYNTVCFWHQSS